MDEAVREVWIGLAGDLWGNASAGHPEGRRARQAIDAARCAVARILGAEEGEVWFTSGGTESNNWALAGAALARAGERRHLVVSPIEHKSVLRAAEALVARGFELTVLPAGTSGAVQVADVERALRPDTSLVALMLANNETGVLQPVREVASLCRERGVLLHCDAVAAVGKVPVDVRALGCDLLSLSGHKLYAPKGVGLLYVRRGAFSEGTPERQACGQAAPALPPLIHGCGQQAGMRSGTENTAGIVALARAFERLEEGAYDHQRLERLRDRLWAGLQVLEPACQRNGTGACLPNTLSVAFPGHSGASLQQALGRLGFSVAAGAAATNGAASHVLLAMGLGEERARSTLRFSLGAFHQEADVERLLEAVGAALRPSAEAIR
jgi:cysteine desulfurase